MPCRRLHSWISMCSLNAIGMLRTDWRGGPADFLKQLRVAIDHSPFGKTGFDRRSRLTSHTVGNRSIRQRCQLVYESLGITDRKQETVPSGDDHLRGAPDVGVDNRPAQ